MTLRNRVTLAAGVAVLLAVLTVSIAVYVVVRANLYDQIDDSLSHGDAVSALAEQHDAESGAASTPQLPLVDTLYKQVVDSNGEIITTFDNRPLPVTPQVLEVARGERDAAFLDAEVDGDSARVYVTAAGEGTALQIGRSLAEVQQTLRRLVWALAAISLAALGLAVVIGRVVAVAAAGPVHRVAKAADAVAETGDLSHHLTVPDGDDLGRLAASFNTMLDALNESLARQRQLVADASHELRTPLATVRTNVEVLARADELAPDERATLIRDTVAQLGELTRLVGDLVELARGDGSDEPSTLLDLETITRQAVEVAARNHPAINFDVDIVPSTIRGGPARISRAVSNLIDNAAKWSPPGSPVEINVRDGMVRVRDRGPGIDPVDLPHVFDRFYRSAQARTMPGSGLGLAIVKQVADTYGGTVMAATPPDGGALFVLTFPMSDRNTEIAALEARS